MSNRIKKQSKHNIAERIPKAKSPVRNNISFSFDLLEYTDYFGIECTCPGWSVELFNMFKELSKIKVSDLHSTYRGKYRVHDHSTARSPSPFPEGILPQDCYQIRISTSKGGVHGVFIGDTFYVIWFDPLHNMYPSENHGGLRKIVPGKTCCDEKNEEILRLKSENQKLNEENEVFQELYEKS